MSEDVHDDAQQDHGHSHAHGPARPASERIRRRLLAVMAPLVVANFIALVILWPTSPKDPSSDAHTSALIAATVIGADLSSCAAADGQTTNGTDCVAVTVRLHGGPDKGKEATFVQSLLGGVNIRLKDQIYVVRLDTTGPTPPKKHFYTFYEFQRERPLILLGSVFALAAIGIGRRHGLRALLALAISLGVLVKFILPSVLAGRSPLIVALVGASAVMFVVMYLSHGVSARTTTAVLGTITSLAITGGLSAIAVAAAHFTGLAGEESSYVRATAAQVDLKGLLLAGIVIGSLGVLNDVTITQASAVWELHHANPTRGIAATFGAAMRIGRDHIASAVNTLAFAYAGASLPLLIIFTQAHVPIGEILNGEPVATELVRMFAGSIGLMAAVPITTFLAAAVVNGDESHQPSPKRAAPRIARPARQWQPSKAERAFRADDWDD